MTGAESCRICYQPILKEHSLREMMFGLRDEFVYRECSACGSLQISEVPNDIERYYPPYYYSFKVKIPELKKKSSGLKSMIAKLWVKKRERRSRKQILGYLSPMNVSRNHKILDVGCGRGELICRMFNMGFESVEGTDMYLPQEINYGHGVRVIKKQLQEIADETYNLVMMHHVFEHMFDPEEELKQCFRILKNRSFLMIRIPVKGFAWEKYQTNWVQLDAPRHFFIHTVESMRILTERSGFKLHDIIFDSSAFQFEGSELYRRDIPLYDTKTHEFHRSKSVLTKQERKFFKNEARRVNENQTGDQAIFYLYKE